jgi:hypothetical protein
VTDPVAIRLPREATSARRAREQLEPFRGSLDEAAFFDLRLLVTELVVEALKAAPDTRDECIELRGDLRDDRVHVEVIDGDAAYWLPSRDPEPGEPGWALYLVRRLCRRWRIRREPDRAMVWLEYP